MSSSVAKENNSRIADRFAIPNLIVGRASEGFLELVLFYHLFCGLWYNNHIMNKEEKSKRLAQIRRLEGLLAYAIKHNEVKEIERLRKALDALIAIL